MISNVQYLMCCITPTHPSPPFCWAVLLAVIACAYRAAPRYCSRMRCSSAASSSSSTTGAATAGADDATCTRPPSVAASISASSSGIGTIPCVPRPCSASSWRAKIGCALLVASWTTCDALVRVCRANRFSTGGVGVGVHVVVRQCIHVDDGGVQHGGFASAIDSVASKGVWHQRVCGMDDVM